MLSEICVRRPVFATMLVMSLVVLGIVSVGALAAAAKRKQRTAAAPEAGDSPAEHAAEPAVDEGAPAETEPVAAT